jgi:hypothetical protein
MCLFQGKCSGDKKLVRHICVMFEFGMDMIVIYFVTSPFWFHILLVLEFLDMVVLLYCFVLVQGGIEDEYLL